MLTHVQTAGLYLLLSGILPYIETADRTTPAFNRAFDLLQEINRELTRRGE